MRANDDTQVDYSLLDDRALGNAVAEKVLRWGVEADCIHHWRLPAPKPGAETIPQTCKRCGTTRHVPAYGDWDATSKKGWIKR